MTMANDQELIVVAPSDWGELRDLYLRDWPRYEVAFGTVQNYIDWAYQQHLPLEVSFYSLPGAWRTDGTIIIVSNEYMFIYTMDETLATLRRTLLAFSWHQPYIVAMTRYRSLVLDVYRTLRLKTEFIIPNMFYHLPRERAAQLTLELPEGFVTGKIDPKHASFINDRWPHKGAGSEAMIKNLLQRNLSMGLYDARGQLAGWCILGENGALSMLGVETKRKGYGSIVIKAFALHLAARGLNAYASILTDNAASRALFKKVGFAEAHEVDYLKNSARMD